MGEEEKDQAIREVEIMQKLKHPNIVSFIDVFAKKDYKELDILMEYADDGSIE